MNPTRRNLISATIKHPANPLITTKNSNNHTTQKHVNCKYFNAGDEEDRWHLLLLLSRNGMN